MDQNFPSPNIPDMPHGNASEDSAAARAPLFSGRLIDWMLFGMAMVSVVMLLWQNFFHVSQDELLWIRIIDYTACLLFATEFFWRWYQERWTLAYLGRNWYALLGAIPVSISFMHPHPWWRVLLILARLGRAIDRVLGSGFTYRLVNRGKDALVGMISGAVTVAVLNEVADVLVKGTYTRNISRALAENELELRQMVREKLRQDEQAGRFKKLPFYDEMVDSLISAVLRVTEQILIDPRTDALVADMLRENIDQIRHAVADAQQPPVKD